VHPYRLDAFDSGESGPMGWVEEGRVRWASPSLGAGPTQALGGHGPATAGALEALMRLDHWPRVEIVMNYVGAGGLMVEALLAPPTNALDPLRGLVVAGTGNGTLHRDLEAALLRAQAAGVRVVRSTRCAYGQVLQTAQPSLPHSHGLSPVKARVALMLELAGASP